MIDYGKERTKYRPDKIKVLLIGEAPPPNEKTFFYVPKEMSIKGLIEDDTSLPATIFHHYFNKRPESIKEYEILLTELKKRGIFLIDIIDDPIKIRGNKENESHLITEIPNLRDKIEKMGIDLPEKNWIFLLARNSYKSHINKEFSSAKKISWKNFRLMSSFLLIQKGPCGKCDSDFDSFDTIHSTEVECNRCGKKKILCRNCKKEVCECGGKYLDAWEKTSGLLH